MTIYHVDAAQISAGAVAANQTADTIRSAVATLMAQLLGLEASWGGAAAMSFQGVISQWQVTQAQVEASLESVGAALAQASATYSEAEGAASALFSGH
ncbi:WXG100 family type VII secretion target [Actinomyces minihominis]|uniref:WXG100 family type VII secretion target n=1 Tax=Actinomyces minihominis TaxID=2002838 RepID=UPI000C06BFBD|nr:WXG100 family type VII secretion target [Actinomyces minihominis]